MRPEPTAIAEALRSAGIEADVSEETLGVVARVAASRAVVALEALEECRSAFDMLVDLFATDTGERLELTYHLRAIGSKTDVYLRVSLDYDGEVPSAWHAFPAALYAEREAAELFGMSFSGHPNPKRLLTSDEVDVYLLRKSTAIRDDEGVQRHG